MCVVFHPKGLNAQTENVMITGKESILLKNTFSKAFFACDFLFYKKNTFFFLFIEKLPSEVCVVCLDKFFEKKKELKIILFTFFS